MIGLTARQAECLDLIKKSIAEKDISPTFEEIREGLGLRSRSGVARLITALKQRGKIDYWPERARSIVVLQEGLYTSGDLPSDLEWKVRLYAVRRGITGRAAILELIEKGLGSTDDV